MCGLEFGRLVRRGCGGGRGCLCEGGAESVVETGRRGGGGLGGDGCGVRFSGDEAERLGMLRIILYR